MGVFCFHDDGGAVVFSLHTLNVDISEDGES